MHIIARTSVLRDAHLSERNLTKQDSFPSRSITTTPPPQALLRNSQTLMEERDKQYKCVKALPISPKYTCRLCDQEFASLCLNQPLPPPHPGSYSAGERTHCCRKSFRRKITS